MEVQEDLTEKEKPEEVKPEEGEEKKTPGEDLDFAAIEALKPGDVMDLPSYGDIQDLKIKREDPTFYDLSFTCKGRDYDRKRIHKSILRGHLESYQKTRTLPLKSFKEANL